MAQEQEQAADQLTGLTSENDETAQKIADEIAPDDVNLDDEPESQTEEPNDEKPESEDAPEDGEQDDETPDEPEADDAEGQTEGDQSAESPEDIAKARAYFQRKAQEETEARKQAEAELATIYDKLGQFDRPIDPPSAPSKDSETEESEATPQQDDIDLDDLDLEDPADRKKFIAASRKAAALEAERTYEQKQAIARQNDINVRWRQEAEQSAAAFGKFIKDHDIPKDVVMKAVKKAEEYLPEVAVLGVPSRRTKLALEEISRWQVESKRKEWFDKMAQVDAKKVEAAKKTAQPSSAAPAAPQETTQKTLEQQAADDIAPDDVKFEIPS